MSTESNKIKFEELFIQYFPKVRAFEIYKSVHQQIY